MIRSVEDVAPILKRVYSTASQPKWAIEARKRHWISDEQFDEICRSGEYTAKAGYRVRPGIEELFYSQSPWLAMVPKSHSYNHRLPHSRP